MNYRLRAVRLVALALVAAAVPASSAVVEAVPRVAPGLGSYAAPAAAVGATFSAAPAAFAAPSAFSPLAAPSALAAPAAVAPLAAPALAVVPAASVVPTGPAAVSAAPAVAPERSGAPALDSLNAAAASRGDSRRGDYGRRSFDGGRAPAPAASFVINDEGVNIEGRAAVYYQEVRRMVEQYKGKLDLSESLDVMDDAYGDVLAKVSAVEAVAKGRGLSQENTHLEETLVWVDGVLKDGKKTVAVHTHRVFFHHAQNPQSEVREGIRRVDGVIRDAEAMFARGGKAEAAMGKLDEVELVFDARGYSEIKEHIRQVGAGVTARSNGRITFKFLDDLAPMPKDITVIRSKLNDLAKKYQGQGLSKIIEGVVYSRYVGLLLELKTLEHYYKLGYKILQSGRELFDPEGHYISELDAVVESPEGKVLLVEAKSARVGLPNEEVLRDKVLYKLDTYRKYKKELDGMIGKPFDQVVFSMDIGTDPDADPETMTERDQRKVELAEYLRGKEAWLSQKYGMPVSFLFLQSGPADGAGKQGFRPGGAAQQGGRKHGKNGKKRR
ncbi:MAG: hypothetical protein HY077_11370 [Elusimicrobia bacterium]|nr:hypothetical protein [Elusimicrobiota bacterium]